VFSSNVCAISPPRSVSPLCADIDFRSANNSTHSCFDDNRRARLRGHYEIHLSLRPNPPIEHLEHSTGMRRLTSLPEKFANYPLVGLAGTGNMSIVDFGRCR
jgi:hypothetical protein